MHSLHRFIVPVRQHPEGRRAQGLLQLLQADVEQAAFFVPVHDQLHRFVAVAGSRQRAQVMLRVAHRRKLLGQDHKDGFRKFQTTQQQIVDGV